MENNYSVYCHISPSGKRYIGITGKDPKRRWNYGGGYYGNEHFTRAIKKYGWDSFEHVIICDGLSAKEASEMEIELIRKYDTTNQEKGYNIALGGMNENQQFSPEIRKKISEAKRGKPCPEWQKKHLAKINKGKIPTNLTEIHKKNQKMVDQLDLCGNHIASFPSIRIAGKECGLPENSIGLCCRGIYKTSGGYRWRFSDMRNANNNGENVSGGSV